MKTDDAQRGPSISVLLLNTLNHLFGQQTFKNDCTLLKYICCFWLASSGFKVNKWCQTVGAPEQMVNVDKSFLQVACLSGIFFNNKIIIFFNLIHIQFVVFLLMLKGFLGKRSGRLRSRGHWRMGGEDTANRWGCLLSPTIHPGGQVVITKQNRFWKKKKKGQNWWMKVKTFKGPTADKNVKPGSKHDPTPSEVPLLRGFPWECSKNTSVKGNPSDS